MNGSVVNGSVMNVVCFEWSVMNGLFWTRLFWTDTLKNIALQLCIITTTNVLGKTCMFIFFYKFSLPSNFLKSPMPYSRSGVPETGCALLADDYSISSKCRSNLCLKFLVAARRQREMMVIIWNADIVKSAEWHDEDNLHISEMIIPGESCTGSGMPVYTMTEHFSFPWENAWSQVNI